MRVYYELIRRNVKLFFKDKGMVFGSMMSPLILFFLFIVFLAKIYRDNMLSFMPEGVLSDSLLNGMVGAQLLSSLLAVICVTVSFTSAMICVGDKITGAANDLTVTPVKSSVFGITYFISSLIATLMIAFVTLIIGFIYLAAVGWYLSAGDVFLIILDIIILSTFGTALASIVSVFIKTQGQSMAVNAIVSAGYGFISGAYMPISMFSEGIANTILFLPGTYGTTLIKEHFFYGSSRELNNIGAPQEMIDLLNKSVDANMTFFGSEITTLTKYLVITLSVVVLIGLYILMNYMVTNNKLKFFKISKTAKKKQRDSSDS